MQTTPEEVKTIQQQVDDLRNVLSINEHELSRVQKLRQSEEYTLGETVKAKLEAENIVKTLNDSIASLKSEVEVLNTEKESLNTDTAQLRKEFVETGMKIEAEKAILKLEQEQIAVEKEKLELDKSNLVSLEKSLNDEKLLVEEKHSKIKELASNL